MTLGLSALVLMPSGTSTARSMIHVSNHGGEGDGPLSYGGMTNDAQDADGGAPCGTALVKCEALPRSVALARSPSERATTFAAELNAQEEPRPVVSGGVVSEPGTEPHAPRPVWLDSQVILTIDPSYLTLPYAMQALNGALLAWTTRCDRLPKVTFRQAAEASQPQSLEENLGDHRIVYAPSGDARAKGALAVTLVTADEGANAIVDADILVNGKHHFTDVSTPQGNTPSPLYDLQNVLAHEFGHWFGLDEDYENTESTMYAFVYPGESKKRDLTDDDVNAILLAQAQADAVNAYAVGCNMVPHERSRAGRWLGYVLALSLLRAASRRSRRPTQRAS